MLKVPTLFDPDTRTSPLPRMKGSRLRHNSPHAQLRYLPETCSQELADLGRDGDPRTPVTVGLKLEADSPTGKLMGRPATPQAAKKYTQQPPHTERRISNLLASSSPIGKGRYTFSELEGFEHPEVRLSLSDFHERVKGMAEPPSAKVKTEEEMLQLKLEGHHCTLARARLTREKGKMSFARIDKAELLKRTSNVYITQQRERKALAESKRLAQTNEPQHSKTEQRRTKRTQVQSASPSRRSAVQSREKAKVSVINLVDKDTHPQRSKTSYKEFCIKHIMGSDPQPPPKPKPRTPIPHELLVEELKSISQEIKTIQLREAGKQVCYMGNIRYTTSFVDEKLSKRKSLMKDYTFKKAAAESSKVQHPHPDDFYVEGWDNSQEFERKEIMIG